MQVRLSIPFIGGPTMVYEEQEIKDLKQKAINYLLKLDKSISKAPGTAVAVCAAYGLGLGMLSGLAIKALALTGLAKGVAIGGTMITSGVTAPVLAAKVNDALYLSEAEIWDGLDAETKRILLDKFFGRDPFKTKNEAEAEEDILGING